MSGFFAAGRFWDLNAQEADVLRKAAQDLTAAGIGDGLKEARMLWAHCEAQIAKFEALASRRMTREPMSHLLGTRAFWEHSFDVTADTLDPRPETEILIAAALETPFERVLDLGTGSGCILLSLLAARPNAQGVGSDLSEAALTVAGRNSARLGLSERAHFVSSSWFAALSGSFDLIVSNPPYIAADEMEGLGPELSYEPRIALTDEADGLEAYREIVPKAPEHLREDGWLIVEHGPNQGPAVLALFETAGFAKAQTRPDLDGRARITLGQWRPKV